MRKFPVLKGCLVLLMLLNFCQQPFAQENPRIKYTFEGNKIFSSEELLKALSNCRKNYKETNAEDFDRINDYCLRKSVNSFMYNGGYLQARTGNVKKIQTKDGLQLFIPVIEGRQYRLGEIEIDGEKHFSGQNILKTFPLRKGEIVKGNSIHKWISFLENLYANQGFVQFSCVPEPDFVDNVVNIKFIIDEGHSFKVRTVKFVTNTDSRSNYFRRYLTFDEGETFSKQKLKETIEKINSSNKFQQIDFDKDIDMRSDEESVSLDLIIKIKKKEK